MLRNWLIAFIFFDLAKWYTQLQLRRAISEDENSLTGISLRKRILGCAVEYLSFAWFLYGTVLYHYTIPQSDLGLIFSSFFCCILVYGYIFMLKCAFEHTLVFCVTPILSCLYYTSDSESVNLTNVDLVLFVGGDKEIA